VVTQVVTPRFARRSFWLRGMPRWPPSCKKSLPAQISACTPTTMSWEWS
jgi:hypothetical protein